MSSSRTITLFTERPELSQRPSTFVVSVLAHGVALSLLSFGIIYTPETNNRIVAKRYTVRHLDLHSPKTQAERLGDGGIAYPGPLSNDHEPAPGQDPVIHQAVLRFTANADKGPQTLVQPDISEPVKLTEETPVPTVVIWSPKKVQVKQIVAPLPEPATASDVKPSVNAPNQEIDLADLSVSSTNHATEKLPVLPSTTSPLVVHGPKMVQMAPATTSQSSQQPTPTAVMSLSDLRMPEGRATLPPVNETALQNEAGALAPGQASRGNRSNQAGGKGNEEAAGDSGDPVGMAGDRSRAKSDPGAGSGSGSGTGLTTQLITLPKDGQFGAVIVGASLEEKFPEMSGVWNNRVAYTVYLHVGLARSWILQYSLPRATEAAAGGNVTRLEAPWPYNIVRPNISPDAINSDALLVHGFVNQAGRFESLTIAFPPEFPEAQFVLDSLRQWQFRPASQDGQTQRVEVLLIIPEERDQAQVTAPAGR
ncbi:MAG TPA: hypothetical protein VN776_14215 [Terracidiphilus sp.]|nr:hypothetical protein [Terracidiphilus sp.]